MLKTMMLNQGKVGLPMSLVQFGTNVEEEDSHHSSKMSGNDEDGSRHSYLGTQASGLRTGDGYYKVNFKKNCSRIVRGQEYLSEDSGRNAADQDKKHDDADLRHEFKDLDRRAGDPGQGAVSRVQLCRHGFRGRQYEQKQEASASL